METALSPMPEVERGGAMLKALRQRAGMTQNSLDVTLGIHQSRISDFEKGRRGNTV
ncbi:MAG: helix-turn-helix domain-containing protein [Desulfovibrio sp.]|jgi:transcriptional regulator with XRE-family HTH domain|nr:helix-turn-helix domain-containing protein [Desulfovibrio sp.]